MKTKKLVFFVLMGLPLLVVLAALPFLPGQVPAHYDMSGAVDRWGSKYELLMLPGLTLLSGAAFGGLARCAARQEPGGHNNEKIFMTLGIAVLALFNALSGFILYAGFRRVENLAELAWGLEQVEAAILGGSMIVIGNLMPKLRRNALMGLRTPWSMKNDTTWKKSQHFGGISFILAGVATIAACFLARGTACMLWMLGILLAVSVIDVYYTYRVARESENS